MKEAADCTLAEVRRKVSETVHCMKLIGQLRKLRQLRKDQAERKGLSLLACEVLMHVLVNHKLPNQSVVYASVPWWYTVFSRVITDYMMCGHEKKFMLRLSWQTLSRWDVTLGYFGIKHWSPYLLIKMHSSPVGKDLHIKPSENLPSFCISCPHTNAALVMTAITSGWVVIADFMHLTHLYSYLPHSCSM